MSADDWIVIGLVLGVLVAILVVDWAVRRGER